MNISARSGLPSVRTARLINVDGDPERLPGAAELGGSRAWNPQGREVVTNLDRSSDFLGFEGDGIPENISMPLQDYRGPLNLGDPGVSASLWKESRGGNNLFRDYRASQPMDLITIIVNESLTGKKEGTTTVTQESSFSAAIRNLFGLENSDRVRDSADASDTRTGGADLSNLARASLSSEFQGDGETERKGTLRGRISAMVAEVLPSGVMRIEGEKIISLNSEEEIMVISGLVRPEDVNSNNEVDSSKLANVRIDYYGNGTIGDAQRGGWLGRILRRWWPL
jgi:flagellar L-ring protein precursor FlgH